ncbi:MAG: hypothetical protein U0V48_01905 [Anaerolineales bacterium]
MNDTPADYLSASFATKNTSAHMNLNGFVKAEEPGRSTALPGCNARATSTATNPAARTGRFNRVEDFAERSVAMSAGETTIPCANMLTQGFRATNSPMARLIRFFGRRITGRIMQNIFIPMAEITPRRSDGGLWRGW